MCIVPCCMALYVHFNWINGPIIDTKKYYNKLCVRLCKGFSLIEYVNFIWNGDKNELQWAEMNDIVKSAVLTRLNA